LSHPAQRCTVFGAWPIRCNQQMECRYDEEGKDTGKCIGF
jgi:hypothetical protein